jgi:hypothetical protein
MGNVSNGSPRENQIKNFTSKTFFPQKIVPLMRCGAAGQATDDNIIKHMPMDFL